MPYYRRRRRPMRRPAYRRRRPAASTKRITRIARRVANRQIQRQSEVKYVRWDRDEAYPRIGSSGVSSFSYGSGMCVIDPTRWISQGVNINQRIGRSCTVIGFQFDLTIEQASDSEVNWVRLLIVSPKSSALVIPLNDGSNLATLQGQVFNPRLGTTQDIWGQLVDRVNWRVLYDRRARLVATPQVSSGVGGVPRTRRFRRLIKMRRREDWLETQTGSGNPGSRPFYLMVMSDSAAIPHPGAVGGFMRIFFRD